jgi:hypothetical protein
MPVFPTKAVTMIFKAPGGQAIQMQRVSAVIPIGFPFCTASMDFPVGNDVIWRDDSAPDQRISELLNGVMLGKIGFAGFEGRP